MEVEHWYHCCLRCDDAVGLCSDGVFRHQHRQNHRAVPPPEVVAELAADDFYVELPLPFMVPHTSERIGRRPRQESLA